MGGSVRGQSMPADHVYTARDWTPMTDEIAMSSDFLGYIGMPFLSVLSSGF